MAESLDMLLVYCPGLKLVLEGWQYHIVDLQRSVKSDSISLPDISAKLAKYHAGFGSSGNNLIINVYYSGDSAAKIGEFINNYR